MMHDDALRDSIAVLALGALPASEAGSLVEHIATCQSCRAEYAGLRQTAAAVGYAAELTSGDLDEVAAQRLKSRVMRAVRSDAAARPSDAPAPAHASRNGHAAAPARRTWLAYGSAAAAAILAMVLFTDDASQRSAGDRRAAQVANLERQVALKTSLANDAAARARVLGARIAQVVAPGSKHFAVAGGEVIASGGRVIVALRGLHALPKGKVYQAWTQARGAKTVAPSITFSPDERGVAIVELPEGAAHLAAVAVSVEPVGGSKAPTSKPKFVRALS